MAVRHVFLRGWGGGLLLVAALGGCGGQPPAADPAVHEVGIHILRQETIAASQPLAGRVVASATSQVRPQVGGIITGQLFKEGSLVKAGDPLYQIDATLYAAATRQAAATAEVSRAGLKSLRLQAQRYERLKAVGGISQQDLDNAEAAHAEAVATIAANEAALASARTNLGFTRVTAPISGRVGRSSVTRGALVTADQESALTTIQTLDPIHVDLAQSSDDYLRLRDALAARDGIVVRLQGSDGTVLPQTGTLAFSDIDVDIATGNVTLRAVFANPEQTLLPGMYVRAMVDTGTQPAILIPQGAATRGADGSASVWLVGEDDTAQQRAVVLGAADGNRWQVLSGLAAGERLVVDGLQGLSVGMPLHVAGTAP